jgi:acylaminoacyl-peptidase
MSGRTIGAVASAPGFAAAGAPRAVETRLVDGTPQAGVWDLATGERRVVTGSPHGVDFSEIEPDGRHIWWFGADADGSGLWWRQPFGGGPASPALPGVPRGRPRGIAFGDGGLAAVCIGVDDDLDDDLDDFAGSDGADGSDEPGAPNGAQAPHPAAPAAPSTPRRPAATDRTRCYVGRPGEPAREIHSAPGYRCLVDLAPDGRHLALAGAPDGPHAAVLLGVDGTVAATLGGGPEARLWALEFRPDRLDAPEILLMAETPAEFVVGTWDPAAGLVLRPHLAFPTTASASWCPDPRSAADRTVLVQHETAGRSRLLLADLDRPGTRELPIPDGTVHDVSCTPDGGTLYCLWSRADTPATLLAIEPGGSAPAVAAVPPPPSAVRDLWTPAPYGAIHSLLTAPDAPPPWPTVFLVHGGPATHDRDLADSRVDVLRDAGFAVVRTNYRGSTGYGSRWQHGFGHRVGLAQAEDLAAVRGHLLAEGLADPDRIALYGYSWGGYLTLLALGLRPDLWPAGVAVYPIADYPETFATTTPTLRAVDVALFGGTPAEVGDRYAAASPSTYADRVRGPVLLVAATEDERCPAPQVRRYAERLAELGVPHRMEWREGAHSGGHAAEQAAIVGLALEFLDEVLRRPDQSSDIPRHRPAAHRAGTGDPGPHHPHHHAPAAPRAAAPESLGATASRPHPNSRKGGAP